VTPLSLILLLVCVFFIGLLSYILFNLLFVVSSKKTKSLHNNRGGLNVFRGDVHNSFESPRNSTVINGLRLTRDKRTGKINVEPNGTFSDHAIFRTLNREEGFANTHMMYNT